MQSASHPLNSEKLEEEKLKKQTPNGKLDKNGKALKFSRDLESDWTVKNEIPHVGFKEHASVDTRYGFVLSTEMTPASHHDSPYLPLCVAGSCHTKEPIKKVFADKGYFGLSHLYNKAYRARFPKLIKNALDALFRQMAFNLLRASRILKPA